MWLWYIALQSATILELLGLEPGYYVSIAVYYTYMLQSITWLIRMYIYIYIYYNLLQSICLQSIALKYITWKSMLAILYYAILNYTSYIYIYIHTYKYMYIYIYITICTGFSEFRWFSFHPKIFIHTYIYIYIYIYVLLYYVYTIYIFYNPGQGPGAPRPRADRARRGVLCYSTNHY